MITNMQYLGIYEDAIDTAINTCEEAMKQMEFSIHDIDTMNELALEDLKSMGSWDDITNSIIQAYFSTTAYLINKRHPDLDVDYYVNCHDSHFYIGQEEI